MAKVRIPKECPGCGCPGLIDVSRFGGLHVAECHYCDRGFEAEELEDRPEPGKVYRLTGGPGDAAISNGDLWRDSEVR